MEGCSICGWTPDLKTAQKLGLTVQQMLNTHRGYHSLSGEKMKNNSIESILVTLKDNGFDVHIAGVTNTKLQSGVFGTISRNGVECDFELSRDVEPKEE